jgi:hypothetical protein
VDTLTDLEMLRGWIPARVVWTNDQQRVEWVFLPEKRFSEPYFDATLQVAMRRPFNVLFRHVTSLDLMERWAEISPGISPSGFIFHVSRCGSTLVSSLLGQLPRSLVLSEPVPLDTLICANLRRPDLKPETQSRWLRSMVSALGQQRESRQQNLFIKFDAWNIRQFPVIHAAFPDVPWVFLYRDPVEVLVSALQQRAMFTVPGAIDSQVIGVELNEGVRIPPEEYCARILGNIYQAGLEHHQPGKSRLINYRDLPDAIWSVIPNAFGFELEVDEMSCLREKQTLNPKTGMEFAPDSGEKRANATETAREMVKHWMLPVYEQLENARLRTG